MKCCCCKKNIRTTRDERDAFYACGYYTPNWWTRDQAIKPEALEKHGIDPENNDDFLCFDCAHGINCEPLENENNILTSVSESSRCTKRGKSLKESSVEALNLSSLADLIYAYGNDLRILHLYVKGSEFKTVHETLNTLYDDVFEAYDTVAELAIARNELVKNPSTVVSIIKPLDAKTFDCKEALEIARNEGLKVLDAICSIEGYDKAVQPALDNIIVKLDKTLNYILKNWTNVSNIY